MDIALIVTIVGAAAGATWVLRSAISTAGERASDALKAHAAEDAANFKELRDNVVQLKGRTRKK
jgi:hypothetical protein